MNHYSVLKKETLEAFKYLNDINEGYFVDATLGLAGHSIGLLGFLDNKKITILGIDKDESALDIAMNRIEKENLSDRFIFCHDDFNNIDKIVGDLKINKVDGALIDLGVSSLQLDDKSRGFSFEDRCADLDMRMDKSQKLDAKEILNSYSEKDIARILEVFGEERFALPITRGITKARKEKAINTVGQLIDILEGIIPIKIQKTSKKHFATNTFRALRIEVNNELDFLYKTLQKFFDILNPHGRLAVITFHSSEDRIVKELFRKLSNVCSCPPDAPICTCDRKAEGVLLTRKPIIPSASELQENNRSRSAKLRIIEKI